VIRFHRLAGALAGLVGLSGCHVYVAPETRPVPGTEVAVVLTDRGRFALSQRIGPEIDQVLGRLVAVTDTSVDVALASTVTIRGESMKWSGERFLLTQDQYGRVLVRTLSKGRTALAVAAGVAAVGSVVAAGLSSGGDAIVSDPSTPPTPPPAATRPVRVTHP
jgi:hypothetical protein